MRGWEGRGGNRRRREGEMRGERRRWEETRGKGRRPEGRGGDKGEGEETRGKVRADGTRYLTKGLGEGEVDGVYTYRIRAIRCRSYYLFSHTILCGFYSRAATNRVRVY